MYFSPKHVVCLLCMLIWALPVQAFDTVYGHPDCNNEAEFLEQNGILCMAVFSEINVWDFLNSLPRRITFDELVAFNPALVIESYETVIGGITFVRVQ